MRQIPREKKVEAIRLRVQEQLSTPTIARRLGICNQAAYRILENHPWLGEVCKGGPRATWTEPEIAILRRLWPVADQDELCEALPNRVWTSIGRKACELNIKRRLPGARKNKRFLFPVIVQLRETREAQGLTRVALAEKSGYHEMQFHQWELGKAVPNLKRFLDWAEALGLKVVLEPIKRPVQSVLTPSRERMMAGRA